MKANRSTKIDIVARLGEKLCAGASDCGTNIVIHAKRLTLDQIFDR